MPIFDYKCPVCERKDNDVFVHSYKDIVKCKRCRSVMSKLVPNRVNAKVFPSNGVFLEHVSPTGKTFHSTQQMRKYEKEHNVELGYLL